MAEEEAAAKRDVSKAAALQQRDAQLQQLEELKQRILAERCAVSDIAGDLLYILSFWVMA